jgi:hypothetical protein
VALAPHVLRLAKSLKKRLKNKHDNELERIDQRLRDMEFVGEADLALAKTVVEVSLCRTNVITLI